MTRVVLGEVDMLRQSSSEWTRMWLSSIVADTDGRSNQRFHFYESAEPPGKRKKDGSSATATTIVTVSAIVIMIVIVTVTDVGTSSISLYPTRH